MVNTLLFSKAGFNPCVGRNSSGAHYSGYLLGMWVEVSIRVLVGIAQERGS